jgi:two-component system OmpR family sensor kinase
MADVATDAEKDPLLSQGAHEIRTPVSVIVGWAGMMATERLGPLTDLQRRALGDIANSTAKLKELAEEMSQLSRLRAGGVRMARAHVELAPLITAAVPSVPRLPDREVSIRVIDNALGAVVNGDAAYLRSAFNSLIFAQRRELVTCDELCVAIDRASGGEPGTRVTIGGTDAIEELRQARSSELAPLVEFRGGIGFKLSIARHVIEGHGGQVFSKIVPADISRSMLIIGATVILPES